jgi:hypothetical protein
VKVNSNVRSKSSLPPTKLTTKPSKKSLKQAAGTEPEHYRTLVQASSKQWPTACPKILGHCANAKPRHPYKSVSARYPAAVLGIVNGTTPPDMTSNYCMIGATYMKQDYMTLSKYRDKPENSYTRQWMRTSLPHKWQAVNFRQYKAVDAEEDTELQTVLGCDVWCGWKGKSWENKTRNMHMALAVQDTPI